MTLNRFLKELFRAFIVGTLIWLGFMVYYYFNDSARLEYILQDVWAEFATSLAFSMILYIVNISWFFFLLKKWDYFFYTVKRISIALAGNVVVTCIGVFMARIIILSIFYGRDLKEILLSLIHI